MKLIASMMVRNELGRYLEPAIASLLEFVDEIRVLDDSSDDGSTAFLADYWVKAKVFTAVTEGPSFYENEGQTRQALLEWTLRGEPTHILAIDADELVEDGRLVRATVESNPDWPAFSLCMSEVWRANELTLDIRIDGGWAPHRAPILWRVEGMTGAMRDGAASGRVPQAVNDLYLRREAASLDTNIFHFGWTNERERAERHARYAGRDGFNHNPGHIASILAADGRVRTTTTPWPKVSEDIKEAILGRVTG